MISEKLLCTITEKNIWKICHVLAQFLFSRSETELNYYYQKVNLRVVSRVAEQLRLWILENFKKMSEMLRIGGKVFSRQPKNQILTFVLRKPKTLAVKHSIEKTMLLNLLDLSTIFSPRLSEETYFHL